MAIGRCIEGRPFFVFRLDIHPAHCYNCVQENRMRRLITWLTNILLVVLVLLVVVFIVLPAVFASSLAMVYSGSMDPAMPMGALAWMEPVDPAEIEVSDIIAFDPPWDDDDVIISHRVIEVADSDSLSFVTKGDANEDPDPDLAPADSVLARVNFSVPNLGFLLARIKKYTASQLGFGLFIALPTVLLIGSAVRDMNVALSPRKKRGIQRKKMLERRKRRKSLW